MDEDSILERERLQIEQIRELDFEELQVEEVEDFQDSDDDDAGDVTHAPTSDQLPDAFTFNPSLASLHTYLGEVEDTHNRVAFLDGGSILKLPLFYLEGVVLFPEATLPLRIIQTSFLAAVERALSQADPPCTIGVIRVYIKDGRFKYSAVGTTAEIRQYRRLEDGSFNIVTRGQQRFRLRRRWIDVEGFPCGEVQIIEEDVPLRSPQDAFEKLVPSSNMRSHHSHMMSSTTSSRGNRDGDGKSEVDSEESFESALSPSEKRMHCSAVDSMLDESTSSDDMHSSESHPLDHDDQNEDVSSGIEKVSVSDGKYQKEEGLTSSRRSTNLNQFRMVPRAFWPFWVYRMYDSYCLAQRAADRWKQIIGAPNMDVLINKPDHLSFYIASKIPVSESTRQELLELDGVSYRLLREIELLENFDRVRCKHCKTVIARRSDMLVMSSEGPLGAYVNPHGFVHEIMTFFKTNDIALRGRPVKEYSWFPGYAWTVANCAACEIQLGWLFTATNNKLKPKSFWAVRSSTVADDMR